MVTSPPAIAVAGNSVYVVLGGTIYKFDAETLDLQAKNTFLEPPQPPGPPPVEPMGGGVRPTRGAGGAAPPPPPEAER